MPDFLTQFDETLPFQALSQNLRLEERWRGIVFIVTGNITITVPRGLKPGLVCKFFIVSGSVTFSAGSGVTIVSSDSSMVYSTQYTVIELFNYGGHSYCVRNTSYALADTRNIVKADKVGLNLEDVTPVDTALSTSLEVADYSFELDMFFNVQDWARGFIINSDGSAVVGLTIFYEVINTDTNAKLAQGISNNLEIPLSFTSLSGTNMLFTARGILYATGAGTFTIQLSAGTFLGIFPTSYQSGVLKLVKEG